MLRRVYDATWGRAFVLLYDRFFAVMERNGLTELRRELLGQAVA